MQIQLVLAVLLLTISDVKSCQDLPPSTISCERVDIPRNDTEHISYCRTTRKGHIFAVSSSSPLAETLPARATPQIKFFQEALTNLTSIARKERAENGNLGTRCEGALKNQQISARQKDWLIAASVKARVSGLQLPESRCFSEVAIQVDDAFAIELFSFMEKFMDSLAIGAVNLKNYMRERQSSTLSRFMDCSQRLFLNMDKPIRNNAHHCRMITVAGFRENGTFAIPISYTASPGNEHRKTRRYVGENVVVNSGSIQSRLVKSYNRDDKSSEQNATTNVAVWSGQVGTGHFANMPIEETPAWRRLQLISQKDEDNLFSSVSASNIAILLFPVVLSLLPISCVEHVNVTTLLVYILLSDVLPVLPLGIKGVDLIVHAAKRYTSCAAYTLGAEGQKNELAVVELWCVGCGVLRRFDIMGKVLLGIAIFFFVIGILIEVRAYRSLNRTIRIIREIGRDDHQWWQRPAIVQYARKRYPLCEICSDGALKSNRSFTSSLSLLKSERRFRKTT